MKILPFQILGLLNIFQEIFTQSSEKIFHFSWRKRHSCCVMFVAGQCVYFTFYIRLKNHKGFERIKICQSLNENPCILTTLSKEIPRKCMDDIESSCFLWKLTCHRWLVAGIILKLATYLWLRVVTSLLFLLRPLETFPSWSIVLSWRHVERARQFI